MAKQQVGICAEISAIRQQLDRLRPLLRNVGTGLRAIGWDLWIAGVSKPEPGRSLPKIELGLWSKKKNKTLTLWISCYTRELTRGEYIPVVAGIKVESRGGKILDYVTNAPAFSRPDLVARECGADFLSRLLEMIESL